MHRCLREPLFHFILIGGALFAVHNALRSGSEDSNQIVLTPHDLEQMTVMWRAQGRPAPTPEEMRSLLETRIREEVLFREALAMGLDKDDTIVKRRMVQKMEFLAEDLSALREPGQQELKEWFAQNAERFASPARVSFRHLYFSLDKRGEHTRAAAESALQKLAGKPSDAAEASDLADLFMLQDEYGDRSMDDVARTFGPGFARSVFAGKPGAWQGPVESGYGWHLVFVNSITPMRIPEFEEVEAEVKSQWVFVQREATKRRMYEEMKSRYEIVVPQPPEQKLAGNGK